MLVPAAIGSRSISQLSEHSMKLRKAYNDIHAYTGMHRAIVGYSTSEMQPACGDEQHVYKRSSNERWLLNAS